MSVDTLDAGGEIALTIDRPRLSEAMIGLRDTPGLQYQQLMEIAGVDYPDREDRFDVCYHLLSLTKKRRLRVRVLTDDVKPVPSVTGIWPGAGWLERGVSDMYGVLLEGTTHHRRLPPDFDFRGPPARKDSPPSGAV